MGIIKNILILARPDTRTILNIMTILEKFSISVGTKTRNPNFGVMILKFHLLIYQDGFFGNIPISKML